MWKGFVYRYLNKERESLIYDASLHGLRVDRTCKIGIFLGDKSVSSEQAKSILASVEFSDSSRDAMAMLEDGKVLLSNGDFVSACISFINAFYLNENNPECAYYLSRVLFEDSGRFRQIRLRSVKEFLGYALKLNPEYQEAKELSTLVDNEIASAGKNK